MPAFSQDLDRALDSGATRVLVDLGGAESFSTAGFNVLLRARQRLLRRRGAIALVLSQELRGLCELLQLDRRFLLAPDRLTAAQLLGLAPAWKPKEGSPTAAAA